MHLHCRLAAESSRPRARLQSEAFIKLMVGIGFVLNTPDPAGQKAVWLPEPRVRFLGMIVDAAGQKFVLPEDKRQDLLRLAQDIATNPGATKRQLAQIAGKMIAAAPALPLSPILAGSLYKAMVGEVEWDTVYPATAATTADMQIFQETLLSSEGGNWWKRSECLLVSGDASEFAFAAYTPDGELQHPMVVTFTQQEAQLMKDNQYSSTIREIICILRTVNMLLEQAPHLVQLEQAPHLVQHKRLRYETDSHTGFYSVMGMKGNPRTFPVVRDLRLLCARKDIELEVVWKPREDPHQQASLKDAEYACGTM